MIDMRRKPNIRITSKKTKGAMKWLSCALILLFFTVSLNNPLSLFAAGGNSTKSEAGIRTSPIQNARTKTDIRAKEKANFQTRIVLRKNMQKSNALVAQIVSTKKEAVAQRQLVKLLMKRLEKKNITATGDQIATLKDTITALKRYQEKIQLQENQIKEIRDQMVRQRKGQQNEERLNTLNSFIQTQTDLLGTLNESIHAMKHAGEMLKTIAS